MIKALIFDFDGLIFDTEYGEFTAWQQVYAEHGLKMRLEDWTSIIGRGASTIEWTPYTDLKAKLGSQYHEAELRARKHKIFDDYISTQTVLPGVLDLIKEAEAAKLGLAVASSSPRSWVEGYLGQLNLRKHFSVVKTETDVSLAKPDPELYLAAMEDLRVQPDEAFALEDSANGTTAAIAAGLFCVTVPNRLTIHTDLSHSNMIVDSLANTNLAELSRRAEDFYASRPSS